MTQLVRPTAEHLPDYVAALRRGFEPSAVNGAVLAQRHLAAIEADPDRFLAGMDDPEARGAPVILPDGSTVPRLPGLTRWIWADGFCGVVNARWQPGTAALPDHVLGHVGYAVVPWRRREGHATRALGLLLAEMAPLGLPHVELSTDPSNHASIRVIEAHGGICVERFRKAAAYGGAEALRFRIPLEAVPPSPGGREAARTMTEVGEAVMAGCRAG